MVQAHPRELTFVIAIEAPQTSIFPFAGFGSTHHLLLEHAPIGVTSNMLSRAETRFCSSHRSLKDIDMPFTAFSCLLTCRWHRSWHKFANHKVGCQKWKTLHLKSTTMILIRPESANKKRKIKHTTVGIRWWSPTQLLIYRFEAYVWQSERDAQFSSICGRMCYLCSCKHL